MNRTICLLLSFALIFAYAAFTANDAHGQAKAFTDQEMGAFAKTSLQGYVKDVLTEKNVGRYGFSTVGEASAATLGDPLRVHSIELKELKAYRPSAGLRSMQADSRTTWYPVIANNEVRAKLEIVETAGKTAGWRFRGRQRGAPDIGCAAADSEFTQSEGHTGSGSAGHRENTGSEGDVYIRRKCRG